MLLRNHHLHLPTGCFSFPVYTVLLVCDVVLNILISVVFVFFDTYVSCLDV